MVQVLNLFTGFKVHKYSGKYKEKVDLMEPVPWINITVVWPAKPTTCQNDPLRGRMKSSEAQFQQASHGSGHGQKGVESFRRLAGSHTSPGKY